MKWRRARGHFAATAPGSSSTPFSTARRGARAPESRRAGANWSASSTSASKKIATLRYQHASDIRTDLQRLKRDTGSARPAVADAPRTATGVKRRWKVMVPAAAAVLALLVAGGYLLTAPRHGSSPTRTRLSSRISTNTTGDPVFDDTLRQGLSVELQQSPFLSLISDRQVQQTLALMGQPKEARLTPELAQQICERTASAAVLDGSIASLGSQYVLGLRARNCNTGNILDQEQMQAARREDVLNALSQIASKFRTQVGESLATVERHSNAARRGDDAVTRSLEGLQQRNEGGLLRREFRGHPFLPARCRNRSEVRDGVRQSGALVQCDWRVGLVGREHGTSLATAGSRQRSREVLHRLQSTTGR